MYLKIPIVQSDINDYLVDLLKNMKFVLYNVIAKDNLADFLVADT